MWGAITALSVVIIGAIAVGLVMLSGTVLSYLQPVLVPLAVAGIIAYLLEPLIGWLERFGWKHTAAMLTVYVGFLLFVVFLVVAVVVPTVKQAKDVYKDKDNISTRVETVTRDGLDILKTRFGPIISTEEIEEAKEWITNEVPTIASKAGNWLWSRVRGAFGFLGYLLGLFLVPIYLFYFLREGHKISEQWTNYIPLRASKLKDEVVGTLTEVNGYLISFFRGQMVVSLIDGALIAFALSLMGLPYALLIGVFLAILGLIPYIGNLLVMIPAVLIAIAHFGATERGTVVGETLPVAGEVATVMVAEDGKKTEYTKVVKKVIGDGSEAEVYIHAWNWLPVPWAYPVIVLLTFVILQQINGLVTAPKIVGDSVGLHPLTVIFSVLFWSLLLGGLLGALLAVPLTAAIKVLFRRYIWERRLEPAVEARLNSGKTGKDNDSTPDDEGEVPAPA